MSGTSHDAYWSILPSDIPHVERALEILLGDACTPAERLEIFSRLAGFTSYATLKSRMQNFTDINGHPFPLRMSETPTSDPEFFAGLPTQVKRRLADLEETGFVRLIVAALVQARHPVLGDLGIPEGATIETLRVTASRVFDPSSAGRSAQKSTANTAAALVLTPANLKDVLDDPRMMVFQFQFSASEDIPMSASGPLLQVVRDPEHLSALLAGRQVYAYSTQDLFDIKDRLSASSQGTPAGYIQLRDMAAHVMGIDGDIAFPQMAEAIDCDEIEASEIEPEVQCMEWLIDMMLMVQAYQDETRKTASHLA